MSNFQQFLAGHTSAIIENGYLFTEDETITSLRDAAGLASEAILGDLANKIESSALYCVEAENYYVDNFDTLNEMQRNAPGMDWFSLGQDFYRSRNNLPGGFDHYGYANTDALDDAAKEYPELNFDFFLTTDDNGNSWIGYEL